MPNREIHNDLHFVPGIAPIAARTDNTAIVSSIVDTANYNSCEFVLITGTNTDADATFTTLVEDGDNSALSDYAAVADDYLIGTEALASFTFADDVECRKIGYKGLKRYVRVTVTPANNGAGNIFLAGVWVLGNPSTAPTANPSQ